MSQLWIYLLLVILIALQGEVTILLAGAAASTGYLNPWAVFVTAVLGNMISDTFWFLLGYYGKIDSLLRRFKWLGVTAERLDLLKKLIHRDVTKLLIIAKLTNWMIIPAIIAIGAARVPWRRWFWLVALSDLMIAVIMVPLGYYMASNLMQVQKGVGYIAVGFTIIFLLGSFFYIRHVLSHKDLSVYFEDRE